MHPWPRRPPRIDERTVGINFVDVLFALVIGRVLDPFGDVGELTSAGVVHLVLAGVLTLTSWVGYHNSLNRPQYFIRFPNLPLLQFVVDIALVVVYWLTANTAEAAGDHPSADAEAILVAVAFLLYVLWDAVALLIRKAPAYVRRPQREDQPARRHVTWVCAAAVAVLAVAVLAADLSFAGVVVVDSALIAIVLAFRFLKEYVTREDAAVATAPQERVRLEGRLSSGEAVQVDVVVRKTE